MAQALDRPRLARALLLVLGAAGLAGPGCIAVRQTHQLAIDAVVVDAVTRRPVPGATVLVLAREAGGTGVDQRRYDTDAEGRVRADERRSWKLHPGFSITISGPAWVNEHYYMAPGYGWIFVPVGRPSGGRPPGRVALTPLPPEIPRLALDDTGQRVWAPDQAFELRVPSCDGVAQGLPEGGGLLPYWDEQVVVLAAGAQESEGGLWLEGGPGGEPLRAFEGKRMRTGSRAFLDPQSCRLRVEESP